jgi:hypothetical protein
MFVPVSHRPGHAQADFGEADAYIGGQKIRFHYFCIDLPQSDDAFVKACPTETADAFCDGHPPAKNGSIRAHQWSENQNRFRRMIPSKTRRPENQ